MHIQCLGKVWVWSAIKVKIRSDLQFLAPPVVFVACVMHIRIVSSYISNAATILMLRITKSRMSTANLFAVIKFNCTALGIEPTRSVCRPDFVTRQMNRWMALVGLAYLLVLFCRPPLYLRATFRSSQITWHSPSSASFVKKCLKSFGDKPHRHIATTGGCEWVCPILTFV